MISSLSDLSSIGAEAVRQAAATATDRVTGTSTGTVDVVRADDLEPGSHAVEVVHTRLRASILDGSLPAGRIVSQVQLAAQLGVSRTPLREALRLLEREGFIEAEHNRRIRISPFSVEDLEQVYAMRITLEALAVALSVPRLNSVDHDAMEHDLARMDRAAAVEDYDGWNEPHRSFHRRLIVASGGRLTRAIHELSDHAERYRYATTTLVPRAWGTGASEHRAILDSALSGDATATTRLIAQHYARVALNAVTLIAPQHDPRCVREALRTVLGTANGRSP